MAKNILLAVREWVMDWYEGKPQARHLLYGMESDYTDLELSDDFGNKYAKDARRLAEAAKRKEKEYEN